MTRYCCELMEAQAAAGDDVSLLYPGRSLPGRMHIRHGSWRGIATYEVVNPLPVPLTYGVAEPNAFDVPCMNAKAYRVFLDDVRPEVIHVHSFQGVHREFFETARNAGVPIVFTTHDYYPMCPRCTLITSWGEACVGGASPEACAACNLGAGMTARRSCLMQSGAYARLKGSALVRAVGSCAKRSMTVEVSDGSGRPEPSKDDVVAYGRLLSYNRDVLSLFNLLLANSTPTEKMYRRWFPNARYVLVPITHAGLRHVEARSVDEVGGPLNLGYYGGRKEYKGFGTLVAACRELVCQGIGLTLHLYGDDYGELPEGLHCVDHGRIAPEAVCGTLREHDVVVVPSKYRETFGFAVLEALCAGVPAVCSDVVGARDLVDPGCIFPAGDVRALAGVLARIAGGWQPRVEIPAGYPLGMDEQVECLRSAYREASVHA